MIFPARELKGNCDAVRADDLIVGKVYFRVQFSDDEALLPELLPRVFVGRNIFPEEDAGRSLLYFSEVDSTAPPAPYKAVTGRGEEPADTPELEFEEEEGGWSSVLEFNDALEQLLECSLRRGARKIDG